MVLSEAKMCSENAS